MRRLAVKITAAALAALLLYLSVTAWQVWLAARSDEAAPAQAIVVLGAAQYDGSPSGALAARLDHAFELWQQDLADIIVVTGGSREGDRFTEAGVSAAYLRQRGVPDDRLRLEVAGTNSWEQLAAAARFLRREDISEVVLVSDPWHALRIDAIADEVGLQAHVSPAGRVPLDLARLTKETFAVAVGRIIGYRRLVGLDDLRRVRTSSTSR